MLSHTISGKWPDSELAIKAEHDMLLEMAGELKSLKASSPEISDNSGSDSEKPNSSDPASRQDFEGEPVAWWDGDMSAAEDSFSFKLNRCYTIPLYTHPASADEWIKCSERLPDLGQRVILKSRGVVQHYMPVFDQGDGDHGMGDYFWDFEDVNEIDNPLVNFEKDCWMLLPEPPKQEQGHE
jgi:hypothetical protein